VHPIIDLRRFPTTAHRIVSAWYEWQAANLRSQGKNIGSTQIPNVPPEFSYWLANPPRIDATRCSLKSAA